MRPGLMVRGAVADDAPALASLLAELGYPCDETAARDRIARLSDGSGAVFVADAAGAAVAVAAVHLIPLFHRDSSVARITAFVVDSRFRRQGVGSALIEVCEAWARAHGAERAEVTSGDARDNAHAFYTRRGFVREGVRFTKRLAA